MLAIQRARKRPISRCQSRVAYATRDWHGRRTRWTFEMALQGESIPVGSGQAGASSFCVLQLGSRVGPDPEGVHAPARLPQK
jgi:hypothetical protein